MSLDDRFHRARGELDRAFDDGERPDFGRVRARQRHRRAVAGGAGTLVLVAIIAVGVARIGGDDDARVTAFGTTTDATATSTTATLPPSTPSSSAASAVTTVPPPTSTTSPSPVTGHISVSGDAPTTLVAVRDDGTLVRLRTDTGEVVATLAKEGDPRTASGDMAPNVITDAAMGPNSRVLYEDCCEPAIGKVVDMRTNANEMQLEGTLPGSEQSIYGTTPAVSPDGKYLAVFENTKIDIYDLATGKRIRTIDTKSAEGVVAHLTMADNGAVAFEVPNGAVPDPTVSSVVVLGPDAQSMANTDFMLSSEFASTSNPTFMPDGRVVYVDRALSGKEEPSPDSPQRLRVAGAGGSGDADLTTPLPFKVADIGVSDGGWLIVTGTDHVVRSFDGTTWREIARGYSAADW